jgi:hypothetical protein
MKFLRILLAVPLLFFSLFCFYGFIASFEPGDFLIFKILYPLLGFVSLAAATWLIFRKRPNER